MSEWSIVMNVNEKGNIGLLKVINDLYDKGFHCYLPFDDYSVVDCIAMNKEGKSFKLQVKFRSKNEYGSYEFHASSVINGKRVLVTKDIIDFWAIYLADLDKIVYISNSIFDSQKSFHITSKQLGELDERIKSAPC